MSRPREVIVLPDLREDPAREVSSSRAVIRLPALEESKLARRSSKAAKAPKANHIHLPDVAGDEERAVAEVVAEGQRFVFKHPVAAQAMYRSLVAEGRRFAKTDEGRAWRARLEASPAIRRLRPLWEAATLNVLEAKGESHLPSQLIELVAQALSHGDMERTTAFLSERATVREEPR